MGRQGPQRKPRWGRPVARGGGRGGDGKIKLEERVELDPAGRDEVTQQGMLEMS